MSLRPPPKFAHGEAVYFMLWDGRTGKIMWTVNSMQWAEVANCDGIARKTWWYTLQRWNSKRGEWMYGKTSEALLRSAYEV